MRRLSALPTLTPVTPSLTPNFLRRASNRSAVRELWLMAAPRPNRAVDITDTFDRKVAALRRHESQIDR